MTTTDNTYKINRFCNVLFNPRVNIYWIIPFLVLAVWTLTFSKELMIIATVCSVVVDAFKMFFWFLHSPKEFVINEKMIKYYEFIIYRPMSFVIVKPHVLFLLKVNYTVLNYRNVTFHQNFIEKIFDIGHIRFEGDVTFTAKRDEDRIKVKKRPGIYGIKHFEQFKKQFEK